MAVNGGVVHGVVHTRGREYSVSGDGAGAAVVREIERVALPAPDRGALPPRSAGPAERSGRVDPPDRVDIAVFYSPGVLQRERMRARGARADRFLDLTLNP